MYIPSTYFSIFFGGLIPAKFNQKLPLTYLTKLCHWFALLKIQYMKMMRFTLIFLQNWLVIKWKQIKNIDTVPAIT